MDEFLSMELVMGSGSPLAEGRFVMHEKSAHKYHVFGEDENDSGKAIKLASFEYENGNEESNDKAFDDALEVVFPHEKTLQMIEAKN